MERKVQRFSPTSDIPHQSGPFVTINQLSLTHHYPQSSPLAFIRVSHLPLPCKQCTGDANAPESM